MLILSIDGGGVRGLLAASLLSRLCGEVPGWMDQVDLYTGTSTGGIIALGLAHGLEPEEIVQLYYQELPDIFYQSWWRRFTVMWRAKYSNNELRRVLEDVFLDTKMSELKKMALIPTFYLGQKKPLECARPKFYDNEDDPDHLVSDVALRTSAAPTFFPSVDGHVDGGLSANNCAVCAMAWAENRGAPLSEIKVLSISTGRNKEYLKGGDKGLAYWGASIPSTIIQGGVDVAHYQAMHFLADEGTYHRLQPVLTEKVDLDDVGKLDYLLDFADQVNLDDTVAWLRKWALPEVTS